MIKATIEYPEFEKLDLRVGKVIAAEVPAWSNKLLHFTVDFGEEIGQKTILSGVQKWYTPEDFLNKNFPFVLNLAERKMGEGVSQGMMLMADSDAEGKPVILALPEQIAPGMFLH